MADTRPERLRPWWQVDRTRFPWRSWSDTIWAADRAVRMSSGGM